MNDMLTLFLRAVAEQSPVILTYIVAIVVALILWQRGPLPSALTLIGITLLLVTTITQMFVFAYLAGPGLRLHDTDRLSWLIRMQSATAFAGSCLRAVGISILLGAVFIGRKPNTV